MSRRWGIAIALVVTAGVAGGCGLARHAASDVPRPVGSPVTVGRLILPVPRGFNSYAMPVNMGPGSPFASHVITNFRVPSGTTMDRVLMRWAAADMKYVWVKNHNHGAPSSVVWLELDRTPGNGCIGPCPPPSIRLHLPLDPRQPWDQQHLANGAPSFRSGYFRFRHRLYSVEYSIGRDASAGDQAAVLSALRSIRPT